MATTKLPVPLLLLLLITSTSAEPSSDDATSPNPHYTTNFSPGIAALMIVLIAFFFLIIFFSIYIHRRAVVPTTVTPLPPSATSASTNGLDPTIIQTFPTLLYSEVIHLRTNKDPLECAVCLCEFSEDETLIMLPRCCHVFHPDCISGWLAGHKTCPVCRADLSLVGPVEEKEEEEEEEVVKLDVSKIGRSNTIAVVNGDRHTLRVTEKMRREIVMKRSASVVSAVVTRRGRSERWGSFVRTLSMWRTSRDAGESSSFSAVVNAEERV